MRCKNMGRKLRRGAAVLGLGLWVTVTGLGAGSGGVAYAETGGAAEAAEAAGDSETGGAAEAAEAAGSSETAGTAEAAGLAAPVTIEYDNLRNLVTTGNATLCSTLESHQDDIDAYQEIWDILKWEQSTMEENADNTVSDEAASRLYSSNADQLKNSARSIYRQIEGLTDARTEYSLEKTITSYVYGAQTLMNTCAQLESSVAAREKSVEALEASYEATKRKFSVNAATQAEVDQARQNLDSAATQLLTLKEQYNQSMWQFKTVLGMQDTEIVLGTMPEPDLSAIDAIDFEADKLKAIGNDRRVLSERHTRANSTSAVNKRFKRVAEAEGTAEAAITATYQDLLSKREQYQAALEGWESAGLAYSALQRKKQAGMLSYTEYLQGEAAYLQAKYSRDTASLSLLQAIATYQMEVRGISAAT